MTPGIPWGAVYSVTAPNVPGPPATTQPSCSTWDFFFNASAWQACNAAHERAAVQAVADRAAYYYGGPGSAPAQAAQAAADDQGAMAESDQSNIAKYYGAGSLLASTPSDGQGAGMPVWVMAALLVGGLWLLRNMNS